MRCATARRRPEWEGRDRFLLSHGHYAIALYAALMEAGVLPEDELETYGADDSRLPMSGMATYTPGMEISGGSLGQGLAIAVGMALGLKRKGNPRLCLQFHVRWRAGRRPDLGSGDVGVAPSADNLITWSTSTASRPTAPRKDPAASSRWRQMARRSAGIVQRVDGNDMQALIAAFDAARGNRPQPRVIICDTMMGKGVPFLEQREKTHFIRVEARRMAASHRRPRCKPDAAGRAA